MKCNQCDNEIGKKFVKSTDKYSNSYIAFGKEKLKYGDVTIEKNNYWTNFIDLTCFKDMTRYKKYDFNDNNVKIKKSNSSRCVPPSHRLHDINSNNNDNNDGNNVGKNSFSNRIINSNNSKKWQRDSSTFKHGEDKEKSKNVVVKTKMNNDESDDEDDDYNYVDDGEDSVSLQPAKFKRQLPCPPQQPRKSHNVRVDEINQASLSSLSSSLSIAVNSNQRVNVSNISLKKGPVTERQDVGESVNDKVNFLKNKMEKWDVDKLLYEFKGPNKKNWDKIISTVDMTGSLMDNVLELLAKSAIKDHVESSELYSGLRSNSFTNINIYLSCLNVRVMQSKL